MKLLDQVSEKTRYKHFSISTKRTYIAWIKQYILYHNKRHLNEMGDSEVEQFLTHHANARQVSVSTKKQTLSAILFLYRDVLHIDWPWVSQFSRSKVPKRLPVVLTQHEVKSLLIAAQKSAPNPYGLMLQLLYGTECG